jgi:hypothetical protein
MTIANKFSPVAFDPKAYASKRRKTDAKFAVPCAGTLMRAV